MKAENDEGMQSDPGPTRQKYWAALVQWKFSKSVIFLY